MIGVLMMACASGPARQEQVSDDLSVNVATVSRDVLPGIYQLDTQVSFLKNKRIALVANHTSLVEGTHLLDTLIGMDLKVSRVFAPEHGFRGDAADGAKVDDSVDARTGIPITSLYGSNKKPQPDQLKDIDVVIFDIQDVGARFYTYLSTLHLVMEACADAGIPLLVLDRPNPNRKLIDGPVLEPAFSSFVGMHPVPVAYGMTIGEYARMINGEGWLKQKIKCELTVVECLHYSGKEDYILPVPPSPNLPDMQSIYLYPHLCFFEGTTVSVGRGTPFPFTVIGEPTNLKGDFTFTPTPIPGASTDPPHKGAKCRGYDLRQSGDSVLNKLEIGWLLQMHRETGNTEKFFLPSLFFDKLAGTDQLRKQVISGATEAEIRNSWKPGLDNFRTIRSKYLLYPDI